jgi:predicted KAP-like P-loop ATPase
VINSIFFLAWFFKSFHYKEKTSLLIVNVESLTDLDEPITSPKQDILRREKFVKDLYKLILKRPLELTGSFTIGLNGSWGEGKTSVINLLITMLLKSPCFKRNYLLIQFDPWYFGDEKAILNAFYDQLEKAFSTKFIFPDIKKSIARYLKIISTGLSLSGIKFDIHLPGLSIEQAKEQIGSYIDKVGRKVLIIIDDIDRLQPDEMALVFKLVRQNSNFKNTIFLMSFDQAIVKNALEDLEFGDEYLEKILNLSVTLPAIEQESIDKFLFDQISLLFKAIRMPEDERAILANEFSNVYRFTIKMQKLFKTIRLAKRYINSLYSNLPSIKSEVYPLDFLLLEIIRIFNTDLYKDIWSNQWYYIKQKDIEREISSPLHSLKDEKKYNAIKAHVENLLKNKPGAEIFKRLLIELFPEFFHKVWPDIIPLKIQSPPFRRYRGDRVEKRIYHPDCFPKYFLFQVPSLEISDEQLERMISAWEPMQHEDQKVAIKQEMFKTGQEGWASKLMERLMDFNEKIASPLALSIIKVIYENANAFSRGQTFYPFSEFTKAAQLMILLIFGKTEKQSIPEVFEDALMKTPDLLFSTVIIWEYKNKEEMGKPMSSIYSIDLKPFQDKVAQRLNEYFVDNKRDIFEIYNEPNEWDFILQLWGTDWKSWDGQFSEIIQDYVFSLVKDDAQKFYKFLYKMICEAPHPIISTSKLDQFKRHYNVIKFKEIALNFKDNESLTDKERELISQFLESVPQDQPQLSQE